MRVLIFDDVVAARRETFELPGLEVSVHAHADDAVAIIAATSPPPDLVCMDFAMGPGHRDGESVIRDLRAAGYRGKILATSSDPTANDPLQLVEARDDLAARLEAGYEQELLDQALARVRMRVEPQTWEAFRLTTFDALSGAEVAARLGVAVTSVYKARSNVQKLLQAEVRDLEGGGP